MRWASLTDRGGAGLLVSGDLEAGASAYDELDRAAYPHFLKRNDGWNTLHTAMPQQRGRFHSSDATAILMDPSGQAARRNRTTRRARHGR
ncbi:hypothetical protein [Streptomyces hygroscopicus]|uniref:hypothetical protein n=1 Tax=Streptomyces hygroscopicus TaxID=1912 RepID=UPI000ADBD5E0|nr:hypothetical protein [Streptomyces hygroscopicus]